MDRYTFTTTLFSICWPLVTTFEKPNLYFSILLTIKLGFSFLILPLNTQLGYNTLNQAQYV